VSFCGWRPACCLAAAVILALATAFPAPVLQEEAAADEPEGAGVVLQDEAAAEEPEGAGVVLQEEAALDEPERAGVAWDEIGAATLDVVILRPLGALATVAGFGFFAVSSPIAAASQRIGLTWDTLVMAPADYTFRRPLGEF
jgi:hypothetical protein